MEGRGDRNLFLGVEREGFRMDVDLMVLDCVLFSWFFSNFTIKILALQEFFIVYG